MLLYSKSYWPSVSIWTFLEWHKAERKVEEPQCAAIQWPTILLCCLFWLHPKLWCQSVTTEVLQSSTLSDLQGEQYESKALSSILSKRWLTSRIYRWEIVNLIFYSQTCQAKIEISMPRCFSSWLHTNVFNRLQSVTDYMCNAVHCFSIKSKHVAAILIRKVNCCPVESMRKIKSWNLNKQGLTECGSFLMWLSEVVQEKFSLDIRLSDNLQEDML